DARRWRAAPRRACRPRTLRIACRRRRSAASGTGRSGRPGQGGSPATRSFGRALPQGLIRRSGRQDFMRKGVAPHPDPLPASHGVVPVLEMGATRVRADVDVVQPVLTRRPFRVTWPDLAGVSQIAEFRDVALAAPGASDEHGDLLLFPQWRWGMAGFSG